MEELTEERISELVSGALQRIAFVFAEPQALSEEAQIEQHAHITFQSEPHSGEIYLSADAGFLQELASNLLGVETTEVNQEEGTQALTELANIIGGELILALGAASVPFTLGLPESVTDLPDENDATTTAWLESDGGRLGVRLQTV